MATAIFLMTDPIENFDDYTDISASRVVDIPDECAGLRFDVVLARLLPEFSRSRLSQWIKAQHVLLDGAPAQAKARVYTGQRITVNIQSSADEVAFMPEAIDFPVVYEDEHLLVINKPAGLVVHPGSGNWSGTLLNGLLHAYPALAKIPRAGIVHRLDKDTSGLMVVAKTLQAQLDLVRQLQARTVKRHYRAIACGHLTSETTVDAPIGRDPKSRVKMAVHFAGKPAVTQVRPLEQFLHHCLLECRLQTGRTHQIRVHMAHIKQPLAADPVYGNSRLPASPDVYVALQAFGRQALHAVALSLVHPVTGEQVSWRARLPDDMRALLHVLRAEVAPVNGATWSEDDLDDVHDDGEWEVIYVHD